MQAQQNQPPQPAPLPPRDRHKEFMSHNPPTFSHSSDPLDADDWLKTVTKKLEIVQCTDREMVLYVAGRVFYIFANFKNGKHSKAILTIAPTDLPLLFQHPFTITLFADVACHDHLPRRHPHTTRTPPREIPVVPMLTTPLDH
jgi:hypothetical protein